MLIWEVGLRPLEGGIQVVREVFFLPELSHVQQWSVLEGHCLEADCSKKKKLN